MDITYLLGALIVIAIVLLIFDGYLYIKNKNINNPSINPIYNPPTYSINPIPSSSVNVFPIEPTQVANYGQVNNQYYINNANKCVPSQQSNAIGWIIENHSTSEIQLVYKTLFSNNNCSSSTGNIVKQVNQNSFTKWNDTMYNGTYATLYFDSPFYFTIPGVGSTGSIDPSYFAAKPGDTIFIAIDNENIAMTCNEIHQVIGTPQ